MVLATVRQLHPKQVFYKTIITSMYLTKDSKRYSISSSSPFPILSIGCCYINQGKIDPPDYAYAVTFDDGFANNFDVAAPLLTKYNNQPHLPFNISNRFKINFLG